METKICTNVECRQVRPVDQFAWRNKARGIRQSWCKACFSASYARRYRKSPEVYRDQKNVRQRQYRAALRRKIYDYLLLHPCVDCEESDPVVLQFDHRDDVEKSFNIADMPQSTYSWERVLREIEKCVVRCANCHIRRTAERRGWYRFLES